MGGGGGGVDIKDSEDQKAMAQVAKRQWEAYNQIYVPAENKWMRDVDRLNTQANYRKGAGIGNIAATTSYNQAMNDMLRQGGNISRMNAGINNVNAQVTGARLDTQNRIQNSQQDYYLNSLANVAAVGLGNQTNNIGTLSDLSATSAAYARQDAQSQFASQSSNQGAIGTGLGMVARWGVDRWQ